MNFLTGSSGSLFFGMFWLHDPPADSGTDKLITPAESISAADEQRRQECQGKHSARTWRRFDPLSRWNSSHSLETEVGTKHTSSDKRNWQKLEVGGKGRTDRQPNTAQGSERPEKEPVAPFQRRTCGNPGQGSLAADQEGRSCPRLGQAVRFI